MPPNLTFTPTPTSLTLCTFLDTHTPSHHPTPPPLTPKQLHAHDPILTHFHTLAQHWPTLATTQKWTQHCSDGTIEVSLPLETSNPQPKPTTKRVRGVPNGLPSKVYVLHTLMQPQHRSHWDRLCEQMRSPYTPTDESTDEPTENGNDRWVNELRERLNDMVLYNSSASTTDLHYPGGSHNKTHPHHHHYQWLHSYAHAPMLTLNTPSFHPILYQLNDPVIHWAVGLWTRYPDMFDYFVPLDVQQQFEEQVRCESTLAWNTLPVPSIPPLHFTLSIHSANRSLRPTILDQLMYRITAMASVHPQRCKHIRLKWFPSDALKTIHPVTSSSSSSSVSSVNLSCEKGRLCTHSHRRRHPKRTQRQPAQSTTRRRSWSPLEINTGATYRNTCDTVTIWRMEEALKTFVHEMMHGFGWDFDYHPSIVPHSAVHRWVTTHFHVDPKIEIRLYEAYVETWATLLNVYLSVLYAAPNESLDTLRVYICDQLAREQRWAVFQVAKVLYHSGFESWGSFCRLAHSSSSSSSPTTPPFPFSQTTSVFSYFIVRGALLWDIQWFVSSFVHIHYAKHSAQRCGWSHWKTQLENVYRQKAFEEAVNGWMEVVGVQCKKEEGGGDWQSMVGWSMRMGVTEWL